jgi:hypothetical protein
VKTKKLNSISDLEKKALAPKTFDRGIKS